MIDSNYNSLYSQINHSIAFLCSIQLLTHNNSYFNYTLNPQNSDNREFYRRNGHHKLSTSRKVFIMSDQLISLSLKTH